MPRIRRLPVGVIGLTALVAVAVIYVVITEVVWRHPQLASDSEQATPQPAFVSPPGGQPRSVDTAPSADNNAVQGSSSVRGDGAPLNGSTASTEPEHFK